MGAPSGPEDSPLRAEGLTWLLGSQGTERGISVCLQDTMYFLKEREDDNLDPLGAHLFGQASLHAYCVPAGGRDSCLPGESGWVHRTQQRDHTDLGRGGWAGGRVPMLMLASSEGSVPHTLAELKRLHPHASVSPSVRWDL